MKSVVKTLCKFTTGGWGNALQWASWNH